MNYRWAMGALALCACSAEPMAGDESAVGTESEAVVSTRQEYRWNKGQPATDMGPSFGRVCFLAEVGGKFYSAGDTVSVIKNGAHHWILTGGGTAPGGTVSAMAVCIPADDDGSESRLVSARHGQSPDVANLTSDLSLGSYATCFLTHVAGHFGGVGDHVQVGYNAQGWNLQVDGNSVEGVEAKARCIPGKSPLTLDNGSTFMNWAQGSSGTRLMQDPSGNPNTPRVACFLYGMKGKFMGYDEYVVASFAPDLTAHYLNGHVGALGGGIGVSAGCISAQ